MQLFDTLAPEHRPADIRRSLAKLAGEDITERGAVFTRPPVVGAILDLVGYSAAQPLHKMRLLEPAFGGGAFLDVAVERLLDAFARAGGAPADAGSLAEAITAVEIHPESFRAAHARLRARLERWGCSPKVAGQLLERWLVLDDFLLHAPPDRVDFVVGNPPYVRQERIDAPLLAEYRRRYATLYDRADLYVPFFERALDLLKPGGKLGYICSNRWIKNRYGGPLRAMIGQSYALRHYIDLEGADAFEADVIAYPAIAIIERSQGQRARIAKADSTDGLGALIGAMLNGGPKSDPRIHEIDAAALGGDPWLLQEPGHLHILRRLEAAFPDLEAAGCRVGIGVATGADRVFIGDLANLPVESSRTLPLLMADDLVDSEIRWRGRGVINPWVPGGRLVDLTQYPSLAQHLYAHEAQLTRRHCAAKNRSAWYRTIDRITAELTQRPKLVIPDIKGEPTIVYDEGRFYPHHNLYWITSDTWDLRALATLLRSSVMVMFASAYSVKMAGGFLRYQAQVLRRVRVPRWDALPERLRAALRAAPAQDLHAIDALAAQVYGLSAADLALLRAHADATRVRRKGP